MFFRGGSPQHVFEHGREVVPEWQGRTETEVLCHRVATGAKPLATIVIPDQAFLRQARAEVTKYGLLQTTRGNQWGMTVMTVIRSKRTLLGTLLSDAEKARVRRVDPTADSIFQRRLGRYLETAGPDMAKGDSALECGLVYGYDL